MCNVKDENISHLFFACDITSNIWKWSDNKNAKEHVLGFDHGRCSTKVNYILKCG